MRAIGGQCLRGVSLYAAKPRAVTLQAAENRSIYPPKLPWRVRRVLKKMDFSGATGGHPLDPTYLEGELARQKPYLDSLSPEARAARKYQIEGQVRRLPMMVHTTLTETETEDGHGYRDPVYAMDLARMCLYL